MSSTASPPRASLHPFRSMAKDSSTSRALCLSCPRRQWSSPLPLRRMPISTPVSSRTSPVWRKPRQPARNRPRNFAKGPPFPGVRLQIVRVAALPREIAERPLRTVHPVATAASAGRNEAILVGPPGAVFPSPPAAISAVRQAAREQQRERPARRVPTSSVARAPASSVRIAPRVLTERAQVPTSREAASKNAAAVPKSAAAITTSAEALIEAVQRTPQAAASGPKSPSQASPFPIAHPAPAKAQIAHVSVQQRAPLHRDPVHRNPDHRDSGRAAPAVPTALSANRKAIVPRAIRAASTAVLPRQVVQVVSAARVATASRARHFVTVGRGHHVPTVSRARRAIVPSSGRTLLRKIVRPDAARQAATESPAAATVRSAHFRHGHKPAQVLPRVANGNPAPSAPLASVPADSASPQVAREVGSQPSANAALANQAATASPQATGLAAMPPTVRALRAAQPSVQESVRLVRPLQVASVNPEAPASPSANRVPQEHAPAVPQGERTAPPQPQVPASPDVPAASAKRALAHRPTHPPKVALSLAENGPAASVRPSANRAVKGTKAK